MDPFPYKVFTRLRHDGFSIKIVNSTTPKALANWFYNYVTVDNVVTIDVDPNLSSF